MKRNLLIAAVALFTTMSAGVAQAQYRDCDRVAADIIGLRLGRNLSIEARLNDRHAFDDDRFWCSEIHRRYGVQEVVLLERRRSGLSWLDILADVLWASSHRYEQYDRRTVIYYPQVTRRYVDVRVNDRDDWRWHNDHRGNDRDRDDRWRNDHDRDHDRDDHRWDNNRGRNDRDWDRNRDRDRDRNNDRDRTRGNDRDRNDRERNNRDHSNNRGNRGGHTNIGGINGHNDRQRG